MGGRNRSSEEMVSKGIRTAGCGGSGGGGKGWGEGSRREGDIPRGIMREWRVRRGGGGRS